MTTLHCNVQDILGTPAPGGVIRLSAEEVQSVDGQKTTLPGFVEENIVNGQATFSNVQPGRAVIQIAWSGQTRTIRAYIPDSGTVTLAELTHQVYNDDPGVVTRISDAVKRVEAAVEEAKNLNTGDSGSGGGFTWHYGSGAPSETATAGDWYQDTANGDVYEYTLAGWVLRYNVTGAGESGEDGEDGETPQIVDGVWWIGGVSTGVRAGGQDGQDGATPEIVGGYWHIDGVSTGVLAQGPKGEDGAKGDPGPMPTGAVTSTTLTDIEVVSEVPVNPLPTMMYAILANGPISPENGATYQVSGDIAPGQDMPGTVSPTTAAFVGPDNGWVVDASHGLTPPITGRYKITLTSDPALAELNIYPWYASLGDFGYSFHGTGPEYSVVLDLTPSDVVYIDGVSGSYTGSATITVDMAESTEAVTEPDVPDSSEEPIEPEPEPSTSDFVYEATGTVAAGEDFPGTAAATSSGFTSNPEGWYVGASHGLTPPVAGTYEITVTSSPNVGSVNIYPYYGATAGWGSTLTDSSSGTLTATLDLTTADAIYVDTIPTTYSGEVTVTVTGRAV